MGLGRDRVQPTVRQMVEHGLECRTGRIELPGPQGSKAHRHAGTGVGLRVRADPAGAPPRARCDLRHRDRRGTRRSRAPRAARTWRIGASSRSAISRDASSLGRGPGDIAAVDPGPREVHPDPTLQSEITRCVVEAFLEIASNEIDLHPRGVCQAPQDVRPRGSSWRRGGRLEVQLLRPDRAAGVEQMARGIDAAANDTFAIFGRGELAGQVGELSC